MEMQAAISFVLHSLHQNMLIQGIDVVRFNTGALEGGVGWPQTSTIFSVTSHFFVKNLLTSQKYIFYRWREQKRISRCRICHRPACLQSYVLTTLHTYYLTYLNLIYFLDPPCWTLDGGSYVISSVCLSVRLWQKFSYFLPLDFSDFLHQVSPL